MIRLFAALALLAAAPAIAQNQQDALQARYDRALAAGYKALMLCSALGTDPGTRRTERSVAEWELAGIQAPLDSIVPTLTHRTARGRDGALDHVEVDWASDMPPRMAAYHPTLGCRLLPIGASQAPVETPRATRIDRVGDPSVYPLREALLPAAGKVARAALDGATYGEGTRTTAVLVRQRDRTRAGAFAPGFDANTPQRTWSVAKSLAATLVGAAVQRGEADVKASAGLGADAGDPRRAIAIDHLLRMASGRYSDTPGNRTDPLYFGGATVEEVALDWPLLHPPGSVFRYANNDTLAAIKAIEGTLAEHPPIALFETLGMHSTVAETDWRGDYILSSQVWTTAADLARFGQLYLNDGVCGGGHASSRPVGFATWPRPPARSPRGTSDTGPGSGCSTNPKGCRPTASPRSATAGNMS